MVGGREGLRGGREVLAEMCTHHCGAVVEESILIVIWAAKLMCSCVISPAFVS